MWIGFLKHFEGKVESAISLNLNSSIAKDKRSSNPINHPYASTNLFKASQEGKVPIACESTSDKEVMLLAVMMTG